MPKLILASTSKYRRALLERLGLQLDSIAPGVDEEAFKAEIHAPARLAEMLAEAKARAVAEKYPGAIVIGGDQVATIDNTVLGQPGTPEAAVSQLKKLAGRTHTLVTAMVVIDVAGQSHAHTDYSRLTMRPLDENQLRGYVKRDNPVDCAGSYKLEQAGIALFERIETDDHTAITGLPLLALVRILSGLGVQIPA